jgi:hypothetical protein
MTTDTPLIRYHEVRALEHAAFALGAMPTRIDKLLLPAYRVEIRATVTDAKPYALIDRHLELGIAQGRLGSVAELAEFFALDENLVDRAVRFLVAVGQITDSGGRLSLTEIGYRSVRDGVRYEVTRHDRRNLYFDAFDSRPFTRRYYESRRVAFVSAGDPRIGWFRPVMSMHGFRGEALTELAGNPDRDEYNLPDGVDDLEYLNAEPVFLPAYVIRAVQQGHVRYLAYTQVGETDDTEITELCERSPAITSLLENEHNANPDGPDRKRLRQWLTERDLTTYEPAKRADGTWQLTLPATAFGRQGLSISQAGSFAVFGSGVLHLWTTDKTVRHRALLERVDNILSSRTRIDTDDFYDRITQISRQLDLGHIDVPTLRHLATNAGRESLATQLDRLS